MSLRISSQRVMLEAQLSANWPAIRWPLIAVFTHHPTPFPRPGPVPGATLGRQLCVEPAGLQAASSMSL